MKFILKITLCALSYFVCHLIVVWSFPVSRGLMASLAVPSLSVVAGFLIGAVGIFLGSLGNLYSLLKLKKITDSNTIDDMKQLLMRISATTREVKQNVYFVTLALLGILLIPFICASNIPYMQWPIQISWLSKPIVLTSVVLWLSVLVFWAIIDCIGAMFLLHKHYETAITHWILGNQR
ncbi:hypothetical protein ES705_19068 [subsurface metagenome]